MTGSSPRLAAVIVADVIARRLVAEDERVGAGAVQQAERDAGVAGVNETALPLDEHDVVILRALDRDLLRRARDEVGHDGVHGDAPSFDEDPRLARGDEARPVAAP